MVLYSLVTGKENSNKQADRNIINLSPVDGSLKKQCFYFITVLLGACLYTMLDGKMSVRIKDLSNWYIFISSILISRYLNKTAIFHVTENVF